MQKTDFIFKVKVAAAIFFVLFLSSFFLQMPYIIRSLEKTQFGNSFTVILIQVAIIDLTIFLLCMYLILAKKKTLIGIFKKNMFKNIWALGISFFIFLVIFELFLKITGFSLFSAAFEAQQGFAFDGYNYSNLPNYEGYFNMPDNIIKKERYFT